MSQFSTPGSASPPPPPLSPAGTTTDQTIRHARGPFAVLVATYSMSVMNDQLFKETALLLVLQSSVMGSAWQGYIQLTFMLSFVLLAAPVGWLADRFIKRNVILVSRLLELLAAVIGALGLCYDKWVMIILAIALMGLRGAIFSPSINGSIPDLYPDTLVTRANGILKVFTTACMLAGIALAGFALDIPGTLNTSMPTGRAVVAAGMLLLALLGNMLVLLLPRFPAAAPRAPFPYRGPIETFATYRRLRRDPLLFTVIFANGYFWFLGALLVLLINALGIVQLGYLPSQTSYLVVAEVVGVAVGGALCGRLATGTRWYRVLAPAGMGMGALLVLVAIVPGLPAHARLPVLLILFTLAGICGGLFMVPQESFIQIRPPAHEKGSVISAANFASFSGMLLAAPVSMLFGGCPPSLAIATVGGVTLGMALVLRSVLLRGNVHA